MPRLVAFLSVWSHPRSHLAFTEAIYLWTMEVILNPKTRTTLILDPTHLQGTLICKAWKSQYFSDFLKDYWNHFSVFHCSRNKDSEEPSNNSDIKTSESLPRQKVFSNWGGEFFKKNLDYRANTNKILEKMNLNNKASNGDSAGSATSSSSSGFKSLARESAKRPMDSSDSSPAKKFKTSSFLNSYSWFLETSASKLSTTHYHIILQQK